MTVTTSSEIEMLQKIRAHADELARLIQEANAAGLHINFNINAAVGACDVFDAFKMVKIDLRGSAN